MERVRLWWLNLRERFMVNAGWLTTCVTYGDVVREESRSGGRSSAVEPFSGCTLKKYNGLIASVDVLVVLATVALTVSLTPYLADESQQATNRIPEIVLLVFMVVGLFVLFLFAKRNDAFIVRNYPGRKAQNCMNLDRILLMVGLVLFYTLSFVLDIFHCIAQFDCAKEWAARKDWNSMLDYVVDILFHMVRAFYLGCSTLFVVIYGHIIPANKCWVRYGLVILFGCNLAIWFDVLLHESVAGNSHNFPFPKNDFNCSNGTGADHQAQNRTIECFCLGTQFFRLLRDAISPMCYPFMYECSVMLGERFMHWFSSCSPKVKGSKKTSMRSRQTDDHDDDSFEDLRDDSFECHNADGVLANSIANSDEMIVVRTAEESLLIGRSDGSDDSSDGGICDSEESRDIYDPCYSDDPSEDELPNEDQGRLSASHYRTAEGNQIVVDAREALSPQQGQTFERNVHSRNRHPRIATEAPDIRNFEVSFEGPPLQDKPASMLMYTVFFLVTISTNVLFLILSLLPALFKARKSEASSDTVSRYFLYYSCIYYCVVLFVTVAGFVVARDFPLRRSRPKFQGLDYLLLISACGPFAYNTLSLVSIFFMPSVLSKRGLDLGSSLLLQFSNMIEVYVQIPFCFFAGRVTALNSNGTKRPGAKYFQAVLIYLSVSNATLWLVNSFATTYNGSNVYYARDFFKEILDIINSCVLPITLFFRFNSALLLLKALRMAFKKPSRGFE